MRDESFVRKALSFPGLKLPRGERVFASIVEGEVPGDFRTRLAELVARAIANGIRLDVRHQVLERWLAAETKWTASRLALAAVFEQAIASQTAAIGLSVSHTHGLAVAAARTSAGGSSAVGIDVEWADRKVSNRVLARISHPSDLSLPPIELWTVKEAVFKADIVSARATLANYAVRDRFAQGADARRYCSDCIETDGATVAIAIAMPPLKPPL